MSIKQLYPMIATERLVETKAFYAEKLGFETTTEMDTYLSFATGDGDTRPVLAFTAPGPFPGTEQAKVKGFSGQGLVLSIPVESADDAYSTFRARGVTPVAPPVNRPWGWRSFVVEDPNGVLLDFFEVVEQPATTGP